MPDAHAEIQTFPDLADHISIRVNHGPRNVRVTAYDAEMTSTTYYRFWLDTDPSDPGPDYMAEIHPDSDRFALRRVTDFASQGTKIKCDGYRAKASVDGPEFAKIIVPRTCVGTPSTVRVAVTGFYDEDPDVVDWAPGEERFYAWVPTG